MIKKNPTKAKDIDEVQELEIQIIERKSNVDNK